MPRVRLPEVTLTLSGPRGRSRPVVVRAAEFTIGRAPDSGLVIEDAEVSRRHAVVETYEDWVELSDCGSHNGTFLNGEQIDGRVELRDGDVIGIGDDYKIDVEIQHPRGSGPAPAAAPADEPAYAAHEPAAPASAPSGGLPSFFFSVPVLIASGVFVIVIVAIGGFVWSSYPRETARGSRPSAPRNQPKATDDENENDNKNESAPTGKNSNSKSDPAPTGSAAEEQVERAAAQALQRMTSDTIPYVFNKKALDDITRQVDQYRTSSALPGALKTLSQHGGEIVSASQAEGVEPHLVAFTGLAETDGGRGGDPVAAARRALPDIAFLRKMFGTELADKSLILLAAYRMGPASKKSHPLLATMRRLVKNPLTDRNVWYLHDKGGIDQSSYDFVVKVLALSAIAQNPKQFGVDAAPVTL